jgi:rhodanese-related sulfurtransferase
MSHVSSFFRKAAGQAVLVVLLSGAIGLAVNHFRPAGLPLAKDWSVQARLSHPEGGGGVISLDEAKILHASGGAVFLDARPQVWYEVGHIQNARSLPLEDAETRFSAVLAETPKNGAIVTYCDGDTCALSHDLALALQAKGFTNVRVLVNGWTLWSSAGLPVAQGAS